MHTYIHLYHYKEYNLHKHFITFSQNIFANQQFDNLVNFSKADISQFQF